MNRSRQLLRGALLSGGGMFVSMTAMLAVWKIFTNRLSPEDAAVYVLLLLSADLLSILCNFGMWVALPKVVSAAPEGQRSTVAASCFTFQAAVAAILGVAVIALWALNPSWRGLLAGAWSQVPDYLWLLAPLVLITTLRETGLAALAGFHAYGRRAAAVVFTAILQVALVAVIIGWGRGGIAALALSTVCAHAAGVLWLWIAMPGAHAPRIDAPALRGCLHFARPLYVNSLLTFAFQRVDTLLIAGLLASPAAVVVFETAKRFPVLLSRGLGAALVPFLPAMSEFVAGGDHARAARLLGRAVALAGVAGYAATFAMVLIQEPLVMMVSNEAYIDAAKVLGLLVAAMCLAVQTGIMGQTLIALGRPAQVTWSNVITAALSIALNAGLIPLLGLAGAGIAAVCTAACSYAMQFGLVLHAGIRAPLRDAVLPNAAAALAGMLLVLGNMDLAWRAGALAAFLGFCALGGVIGANDARMFVSMFRQRPPVEGVTP